MAPPPPPNSPRAVITVAVYHFGCFIEYAMRVHDGARVFPVHGMWYV